MLRLVLDEGISPSISPRLWAEGVDNYPLRDRGLLGLSDHEIWAKAQDEERAVVTINGTHFRPFARRDRRHNGLLVIPSGGTRDHHFDLVMRGVDRVREENAILPSLRNQICDVSNESADIEVTGVGSLRPLLVGGRATQVN